MRENLVALGAEIATRSETDIFLAAGSARPRIVAEAQLSASICELVANGAGVSIVEPVTTANFAAAGRVIARPLHPEQPFRYDLHLPALRESSRVAAPFLELVEARFATLLSH
ncbi:LysR substrate-binding domain-containing protein [Aurantimonas sp. E1-2-R+4]|uniref:LysR substrate-binding domain-containing protein n=1 Tax=Aurantimonas sp. E1-2-R+4 TaxID=3113714 RepID=UPI002F9477EF